MSTHSNITHSTREHGNLPELRVRLPHDGQHGLCAIGKRDVFQLAVEYEGTAWEHRGLGRDLQHLVSGMFGRAEKDMTNR